MGRGPLAVARCGAGGGVRGVQWNMARWTCVPLLNDNKPPVTRGQQLIRWFVQIKINMISGSQ